MLEISKESGLDSNIIVKKMSPQVCPMALQIARHQFTVGDYHRMVEAGILSPFDKVELIDGEVIQMSPIGSRHAGCVNRLNRLLNQKLGPTAIVAIQNPVRLNEFSEPQPDVCVLQGRDDFYASQHPTASDILLIVEVADSTLEFDREVKRHLYESVNISEYWLVNLVDEEIEVYRQSETGKYSAASCYKRGEIIPVTVVESFSIQVEEILG